MATTPSGDRPQDRASEPSWDPDQVEQQTPVDPDVDPEEWEPVDDDGPVSPDVVEQHQVVELDPDERPAD